MRRKGKERKGMGREEGKERMKGRGGGRRMGMRERDEVETKGRNQRGGAEESRERKEVRTPLFPLPRGKGV